MASHAPQTLFFVTNEGSVSTSGGSTRIAKGQIGLVDKGGSPTAAGMPIVHPSGVAITSSTADRNRLYELRLGIAPLTPTRSQSNKAYSTVPFKLSEIVDIKVNYPKVGVSVDDFLIGYDGINASSAIVMSNGDNEVIDITLAGEAIGMLGYPDAKVTVKLYLEAPNTGSFTMHQIIEEGVKRLKNVTLVGGVPITNYIDITPVNSTNVSSASILQNDVSYTFFKLTLKDKGNHTALGLVQAQYPSYVVKRESFTVGAAESGTSVYVILAPTNATISNYNYAVATLSDTDCNGIPEVSVATTLIAWTQGSTCAAIQKTYTLQLKDDFCSGSLSSANNLAALKLAYPDLTVLIDTNSTNWAQLVTLNGTTYSNGQTLKLVLGGVTYTATVATGTSDTPTTLAAAFVTANATNINTATGATVTAASGVITFTDLSEGFYPVTFDATSTIGTVPTVGVVTNVGIATTGGCQTVYRTEVTSSVVCEDCSPILRDLFIVADPAPYMGVNWVAAAPVYNASALMGIRLKGKVNIFAGGEEYRDDMPFVYSSTRLSVANVAPGAVSESFNMGTNGRFKVKLLSIATEPEAIGGKLYDLEERTRVYFENRQRLAGNNFGKLVLGQESHLKPTAQYVDYLVRVRTNRFAQSFSGELVENFDYHILVEVGKATAIHTLLADVFSKAGLGTFPTLTAGY